MPVLTNPKHELFCQELAKGKTADEASELSGHPLKECDGLRGFYVYLLIDPRDGRVFYVGKGKNKRHADHVREWVAGNIVNGPKFERIGDILSSGAPVVERCFADGLPEGAALDLEYSLIQRIGLERLTNLARGEQSDRTRAIVHLKDTIRRIRPFCRWKLYILPQLEGISPAKYEQFYWDIIGALAEHLAELEGKEIRKFPMMHKVAA